MNRAERRRLVKETGSAPADKVYYLKESDIKRIKDEVTKDAVNKAFILMLGIPLMIVHDKWDDLELAKSKGGNACEEMFSAHILELYETYNQGYVTLEELCICIYKETGIKVQYGGIDYESIDK